MKIVLCPVCRCSKWSRDKMARQILKLPNSYDILLCVSCGLRRLEPQLNTEELTDLYMGAYFKKDIDVSFKIFGIEGVSTDYMSEIVAARHQQFTRTLDKLMYLNPKGKTLLDVGAATGEFVKIAKDKGLIVDGIEYSEYAITKAREEYGIELRNLPLSEVPKDTTYDFIHLNHVFEHFNDPATELSHIFRLLDKEGLLYIEVPYQFHFIEKSIFKIRRKTARFNLYSLHHPFFYTPKTIIRLLNSQCFQVISCSVFDPARCECGTVPEKIKKSIWYFLSWLSIGNYIILYSKRIV